MAGERLGSDDARLLVAGFGDLSVENSAAEDRSAEVLYWANRIRGHFFGNKVGFCCIAPGRLGGCDQDCAWCGQSARHSTRAGQSPGEHPQSPRRADLSLEGRGVGEHPRPTLPLQGGGIYPSPSGRGRPEGPGEGVSGAGKNPHPTLPLQGGGVASRTPIEELKGAARTAQRLNASCFCVVNPGRRPAEADLLALEELNAALTVEKLPPACASLGELDEATARRLRRSGVARYNHNLETSRGHFGRMVTTHTYDERLATLRAARSAGMALCCGGIFGFGETWADRIELALTLREEVAPDVLPLNFLDARPGTPLAEARPLRPMECLHIIALFRFLLPSTNIKIAGGRRILGDLQSWVFHAGATSLMVGDYLTTCGRDAAMDAKMVADLGLELNAFTK